MLLSISSFGFYLIDFHIEREKGDLVENTIYSQLSEVVAVLSSGLFYTSIGAKNSFILSYSLVVVGVTFLWFSPSNQFVPLFFTISKFGISSSLNICFLSSIDLIPSLFQATSFGYCNAVARMLTIFAMDPYVSELELPYPFVLGLVLALLAIAISSQIQYKNL